VRASAQKQLFSGRVPVVWKGQVVGWLEHCTLDGSNCTGRWIPGISDASEQFSEKAAEGEVTIGLGGLRGQVLGGAENGELTVHVWLPVGG